MSIDSRLAEGPLRVRPLWDDQMTADLPTRTLRRRRQRFVMRSAVLSAAVLGVSMLTWSFLGGAPYRTTSDQIAVFPPSESSQADQPSAAAKERAGLLEGQEPTLVLSDGSLVYAKDASQITIEQQVPAVVRTKVHRGTVLYSVTKNAKRSFDVTVGGVEVHVVGTTFAVTRDGERALVDVEEGTVRVSFKGGQRVLHAGQRDWFPPEAGQEPFGERSESVNGARGQTGSSSKSLLPARNVKQVEAAPNWRKLAAAAEYEASYEAMSKERAAISSSASDLMLAADVARLSRHPAEAARLLLQVSSKFPGDPRAPLAEFTRGRVLIENLGQPAQAASAFARARALSPGGSLAQDALVREMDARKAAGQSSQVKALAQLYLSSYPGGRHRAKCEKLLSAD